MPTTAWTRSDGRPTPEATYMQLAFMWAQHSTCSRAQVGAVITTEDLRRTVGHGYNGGGVGMGDNACAHEGKIPGACEHLHAEENAILYAVKNGARLQGATLYTTLSPCLPCARLIYSAGVTQVFYRHSYAEYKGLPNDEGVDFLNRFGVKAEKFTE